MKKFLVTGSCGLVGSEISKFILDKGHKVIGIDNNLRQFFFGKSGSTNWVKKNLLRSKNYTHKNIDIRNSFILKKLFKNNKNFFSIIHCAAQPSHDWAKKNPQIDFDVNARSTLNLLELTKNYSPNASFIFLSTNKVYGDSVNNLSYDEKKTRLEPKGFKKGIDEKMSIDRTQHSLFGASKLSADIFVQEFGRYFNMKTVSLRCGCLTGPLHSGAELHGFLSYLVKCYVNNKIYKVYGYKGKQVRDNLHSYDLAKAIWEIIKNPISASVYNMGGGIKSNCSIIEAINYIEKIGKKKFNHKVLKNERLGDHKWWISNTNAFKRDYPRWKQSYNQKQIIKELYENYKNHL